MLLCYPPVIFSSRIYRRLRIGLTLGLLAGCLGLSVSLPARALTVEEAYQAIPRPYTPFDDQNARMRDEDRDFLTSAFFPLLNEAVVTRVEMLQWFQTTGSAGTPYEAYHAHLLDLLSRLKAQTAPERLRKPIKMVEDALRSEDDYFCDWAKTNAEKPHKSVNPEQPDAARAHRDLLMTYELLERLYPRESEQNQNAFYNTLTALDLVH